MQDFTITKPDFGKNPIEFFKEVRAELIKVTWPNRVTVLKLTGVVVGTSVLVGAYLGTLDFTFTKIMEMLLKK